MQQHGYQPITLLNNINFCTNMMARFLRALISDMHFSIETLRRIQKETGFL